MRRIMQADIICQHRSCTMTTRTSLHKEAHSSKPMTSPATDSHKHPGLSDRHTATQMIDAGQNARLRFGIG